MAVPEVIVELLKMTFETVILLNELGYRWK